MRRLLYISLLMLLPISSFAFDYPGEVTLLLNHMDISDQQKMQAAEAGMQKYGWQVTKVSDKLYEGDYRNQFKVTMEAIENGILLKYITKVNKKDYKFYRRLLSIRAETYMDMLDCKSPTYRLNPAKTETIRNLRAAVYAMAKYHWNISEITETKIISSLPAKGRLEADIVNGNAKFKFWNELNGKYEGDANGYVQRVNSLYQSQLVSCGIVAQ